MALKEQPTYYVECDVCGKSLSMDERYNDLFWTTTEARSAAQEAGWHMDVRLKARVHVKDVCDACWNIPEIKGDRA